MGRHTHHPGTGDHSHETRAGIRVPGRGCCQRRLLRGRHRWRSVEDVRDAVPPRVCALSPRRSHTATGREARRFGRHVVRHGVRSSDRARLGSRRGHRVSRAVSRAPIDRRPAATVKLSPWTWCTTAALVSVLS